jgi:ubiquinone/menaquinone biosynthesis C-methylase UbiE
MSTTQISTTEKFKEQIRQEWEGAAAAWRKWNPQLVISSRAATEAIVELAKVKPGMRVLDLASGSGEPALTLAKTVEPNGHVIATDLVPAMLAIAEDNARDQALTNMAFKQADAELLPFADQSFDVVTCRFGVMFFPNVGKALKEIKRVLKPGGLVAFVAWGPLEKNAFVAMPLGVLMKYAHVPPPEPGAPGPFVFAESGKLSTALKEAGFQQMREETRNISWLWPGPPEQGWEAFQELGAPFRKIIESLSPEQKGRVKAEVLTGMRQYYDGKQVNSPAAIVLASAVR